MKRDRQLWRGKEVGEQVFLIHKIVISMTDLVHGDKRALHSNWRFSAPYVILN